MIIGDDLEFFVQLDSIVNDGCYYMGPFNFWIDGKAYPGKEVVIALNSEIESLKGNFENTIKRKFIESNLPIDKIDFDDEEINEKNLMYWYMSEMGDNGLKMMCEVVGETLRIFYSQDNSQYKLKEINLSYYQTIIDNLNFIQTNLVVS